MRSFWILLSLFALLGCGRERLVSPLPPGIWVDSYAQQSASKVDVLWVVDSSGSMEERQANLAKNFDAFIDLFSKGKIDFRIAVTTTDIFKDQGQLRGSPKVLKPSTANLSSAFAKNVKVGIDGSPYEAGLQAAQMALERQASTNAPQMEQYELCRQGCVGKSGRLECLEGCANASSIEFLRPDAYLYLIFVTDEEDKSSQDIRYYWRSFETAKGVGNDGTVTTAAIIGDVPTNTCGATPGSRYLALSQLTGGEVGSICDADFALTLRKLATSAVGLKRKFVVTRRPNVQTMDVRIRYPCNVAEETLAPCAEVNRDECAGQAPESMGTVCKPPQGGPDGWQYEEANSVIYFAGDSVPLNDGQVEIHYYEEGDGP